MATSTSDPRAIYAARLAARRETAAAAARGAERCSHLRLLAFVLLLVLLFGASAWGLSAHLLWLPVAAFVLLVLRHARASAREREARGAAQLQEEGLARLDGTWAGRGDDGAAFVPPGHVYAEDLDLFGGGSVFARLCVARTAVGARRLAAWLLAPAPLEAVRARQAAVAELAPRLDLRDDLALAEDEVHGAVERGDALAWAAAPRRLAAGALLHAHRACAALTSVLLVGWLALGWPALWMVLAMAVQYVLAARSRAVVHEVLEAADHPAQDLALTARILRLLEDATFDSPHLAACVARLRDGGAPPSASIARLQRLMDLVDARRNQIFLPVSWVLSLGTRLAYALEAWRAQHGARLAVWLDVVAEVEALASLATYAFEHPADPFPELVEAPVFDAEGLGHPLLPEARNVRNDVHLELARPAPQALLISGSNMSGKSTLLRSVGVATVLAFAGAPVRARRLRVAALAVGASIRLHDSIQDGASRFYAEIERLRAIVDLLQGERPVLFLVDEILHGTNSRDRRIGAAAVVRTLLEGGALGLVTTHDLAIAAIADPSEGRIVNMHFEDQVEAGRIAFDYRLRPGVVARGNALALMRMVGLDVADDAADADI